MKDSPPPLAGVAGEIEEAIGRVQTIRLITAMSASTSRSWRVCFYVPKTLGLDHELVRILGWSDARHLCSAFGGEILQTSNLNYLERAWHRWSILKLFKDGEDPANIAEWLGLSAYRVREILRGKPPEGMSHLNAHYGFEGVA